MNGYLPLLTMGVLAALFAAMSFLASAVLGPRRRETSAKIAPYECGIVPSHEPAERFPVRFYLVAMIFIIFDIEIVFTYPWAVAFGDLKTFGLVEMVVFAAFVFASFLYLVSNGALDWGPARRLARPLETVEAGMPGGSRTSSSTVRRVAREETFQESPVAPAGPAPHRAA